MTASPFPCSKYVSPLRTINVCGLENLLRITTYPLSAGRQQSFLGISAATNKKETEARDATAPFALMGISSLLKNITVLWWKVLDHWVQLIILEWGNSIWFFLLTKTPSDAPRLIPIMSVRVSNVFHHAVLLKKIFICSFRSVSSFCAFRRIYLFFWVLELFSNRSLAPSAILHLPLSLSSPIFNQNSGRREYPWHGRKIVTGLEWI